MSGPLPTSPTPGQRAEALVTVHADKHATMVRFGDYRFTFAYGPESAGQVVTLARSAIADAIRAAESEAEERGAASAFAEAVTIADETEHNNTKAER